MTFINTNGMVLIGPGSEWLWTAISGVVLSITFVAIYRQLRLQRGAAAIEQMTALQREWSSEAMARSRLAVLVAIRDGAKPGDLPSGVDDIGNFFERVSFLVRAGHIQRGPVHATFALIVPAWWAWLAPSVSLWREEDSDTWTEFEWLASLLVRMSKAKGRTLVIDEAYLGRTLPGVIQALHDAIRKAEDLRSVVVRRATTQ
jgi:hypothetical protein